MIKFIPQFIIKNNLSRPINISKDLNNFDGILTCETYFNRKIGISIKFDQIKLNGLDMIILFGDDKLIFKESIAIYKNYSIDTTINIDLTNIEIKILDNTTIINNNYIENSIPNFFNINLILNKNIEIKNFTIEALNNLDITISDLTNYNMIDIFIDNDLTESIIGEKYIEYPIFFLYPQQIIKSNYKYNNIVIKIFDMLESKEERIDIFVDNKYIFSQPIIQIDSTEYCQISYIDYIYSSSIYPIDQTEVCYITNTNYLFNSIIYPFDQTETTSIKHNQIIL